MRNLGYSIVCIATLFVALTAIGCQDRDSGNQDPGDGRSNGELVARVVDQLDHGHLAIYPHQGVSWERLIDLAIFDDFWPGMTGEEAERVVGPADQMLGDGGEQSWTYRRPGAQVVVAHKSKGSFIGGWWWRLDAYFDPALRPAKLLHESIVEVLPASDHGYTVVIMNNRDHPAVFVSIDENGHIIHLDWTNNRGSGGARDLK